MQEGIKNLAANVFLDMVAGKIHDKSQVRTMACEAWAYALIFAEAEPTQPSVRIDRDATDGMQIMPEQPPMMGCRKCFGSGGKKQSCKVCGGTGKVPREGV